MLFAALDIIRNEFTKNSIFNGIYNTNNDITKNNMLESII